MELLFNHNTILFDTVNDPTGIELGSYDTSNVVEGAACTRDAEP